MGKGSAPAPAAWTPWVSPRWRRAFSLYPEPGGVARHTCWKEPLDFTPGSTPTSCALRQASQPCLCGCRLSLVVSGH